MKHALVVYESMFGNTAAVAEAVAAGLREGLGADGVTDLVEVGAAPVAVPADVDLLVVGGPTHAFSMTRQSTRQSGVEQGADPVAAAQQGIREWLVAAQLPAGLAAATFDTRTDKKWVPGAASKAAARQLRHRGLRPVVPPQDFYVTGTEGPLAEGELARAREWGQRLATG